MLPAPSWITEKTTNPAGASLKNVAGWNGPPWQDSAARAVPGRIDGARQHRACAVPRRRGVHSRQGATTMDVFETVRTILAVRRYQQKPVPDPVVRRIVEAGHLTASSMNLQPWHFIVVQERDTLRTLCGLARTGPYIAEAAVMGGLPDAGQLRCGVEAFAAPLRSPSRERRQLQDRVPVAPAAARAELALDQGMGQLGAADPFRVDQIGLSTPHPDDLRTL